MQADLYLYTSAAGKITIDIVGEESKPYLDCIHSLDSFPSEPFSGSLQNMRTTHIL